MDIDFHPSFPPGKITLRPSNMWRYREAIPIPENRDIVSFSEGFTPMLHVPVGGRDILIKQEQLFSTGSYKDRGASVLVTHIKALGIEKIVEDSSGNAGSAIAAYCALAGIECEIFVPGTTSIAKMTQVELFGAQLNMVKGNRQDTATAVLKEAENTYYASHSWNPFFFHGTKTFSFEVWEQLGEQAPDIVILPVGNGTLLYGAYIGFNELLEAGKIDRMPRLVGVQAQNCAPLYWAFKENVEVDFP
ncbi:MAG: pyridoxal-phosphate dependent enzyme, partial [bacterium]|nr:pyridoxal-phosphate dependent enzyme [bacterium]